MPIRNRYDFEDALHYAECAHQNDGDAYLVLWDRDEGYLVFWSDAAADMIRDHGAQCLAMVKRSGRVLNLHGAQR